jgi:hypothetical protein
MQVLEAASEAEVPTATVRRHLPMLSHCLPAQDEVLLVVRATRPYAGDRRNYLLVLTRHRLLVTAETGLRRRVHLHLTAALSQLADVIWTPEPALGGVQLSATAVDGVREHFYLHCPDAELVGRILQTAMTSGSYTTLTSR